MMSRRQVNIKLAGEAGQGLNVSAYNLARAFTRQGRHVFLLTENPNSIKLEPTWCSLRVSDQPLDCQTESVDILAALTPAALARHQSEVSPGGVIIYDAAAKAESRPGINYLSLPLAEIARELQIPELLRNTVVLGALLALIDFDPAGLNEILTAAFQRKGAELARQNLAAAAAGAKCVQSEYGRLVSRRLTEKIGPPRLLMTGNDALGLGAIRAGCKFLAAYPMTPASPILRFLAGREREFNLVVKHTEDEIAALNMAIGAAYAGVRAMTCTSGGGFSLMTEALGLAGQSETPVVVVVGQRPGPATGQPTHTGQTELRQVLHASQGEFPRFVIAPGDPLEAFRETFNAFNLAEEFQVPVLILTDKYLGESYRDLETLPEAALKVNRGRPTGPDAAGDNFARYRVTPDGISPRACPGQAGFIHPATSYEHDEYGFYQEDPAGVIRMQNKRFAKLPAMTARVPAPKLYGPQSAAITLIAWGSTLGPAREAIERLAEAEITANLLHFTYLWPLPAEMVREKLAAAGRTMVVEGNHDGQLAGLLRQETGFQPDHLFLKYDGQPFYPVEICRRVQEAL